MYNILVVDDDKEIADSIKIYLEEEGYNVFECYDGEKAIEILKKKDIHLVLLDIMMPKIDGIAVAREIRKTNSVPIIFISAKTGQRVDKIFDMINTVANNNAIRVSTSILNQVINEAIAVVQPPTDKGRRLKILYATQASTKPPTFVIFVNSKKLFHFSYERYLVNQIRTNFGITGTPIRVITREKGEKEE